MERGVSAMKKILLIMMTVTTALVMTACSGKTNSQTSSEDYKYSSYVYDDHSIICRIMQRHQRQDIII